MRFTERSNRVFRPERSTETQVGGETCKLASVDVTGFVENVDFIGVERSLGADRRHTSGPEKPSAMFKYYRPCQFCE